MILTRKLKSFAVLLVIYRWQFRLAGPIRMILRCAPPPANVFNLSEAKGKFVALHFLLKTECPYCIRHTHDYAKKSADDSRVAHLFLKPDTEAEIKAWASKLGDVYWVRNVECLTERAKTSDSIGVR